VHVPSEQKARKVPRKNIQRPQRGLNAVHACDPEQRVRVPWCLGVLVAKKRRRRNAQKVDLILQILPSDVIYLNDVKSTKMNELSIKQAYPWKLALWSWLLVGTLDITAATLNYWIGGGRQPINIFIYIASGVFGQTAFEVGAPMAWWGLVFHYFIALTWTLFFFFVYARVTFLSNIHWVITGIIYGAFIWLIMNRVVVPLSGTPKSPFRLSGAVIQCCILIAMIGLPLSYISRRRLSSV